MLSEMGVDAAAQQKAARTVLSALQPGIDLMEEVGLEVEAFEARYLRELLWERLEPGHGRRRPPMPGTGLKVLEGGWEPALVDPAGWPA